MTMEVGQPAPDFALKDQHGQIVKLSDYAGDRGVAIVFYPFAFSGTCTSELCEIRDNLSMFDDGGVQVLAVSADPMYTLRAFADAEGYTFPLLSDFWPHGSVAKEYGVFNEKSGAALRGTFLVDAKGVLRWQVINQPGEARDFAAYREAVAAL